MIKIAPSVLSADFAKIGEELKRIDNADWVHCDVMDGVFVPNISFGPKMVADIKKSTKLPLDVHLMIVEPEKYIQKFIEAGADLITFHVEATKRPNDCLDMIAAAGIMGGIVISPDTPVAALESFISRCQIVLLMSVYPGFSGQKFITKSLEKLAELKRLRDRLNPSALIEIDGGITVENIREVRNAGAQIAVGGNAVFAAKNPSAAIDELKAKCK